MTDGISELAKLFKDRESKPYMGPQVGEVVSPPPDLKIKLGNTITLGKEHLVVSAHVLDGYKRKMQIPITQAEGETSYQTVGDHGQHKHNIETVGLEAEVTFSDTLKPGDKVILIPSNDEQTYFVVDKAVRL